MIGDSAGPAGVGAGSIVGGTASVGTAVGGRSSVGTAVRVGSVVAVTATVGGTSVMVRSTGTLAAGVGVPSGQAQPATNRTKIQVDTIVFILLKVPDHLIEYLHTPGFSRRAQTDLMDLSLGAVAI